MKYASPKQSADERGGGLLLCVYRSPGRKTI